MRIGAYQIRILYYTGMLFVALVFRIKVVQASQTDFVLPQDLPVFSPFFSTSRHLNIGLPNPLFELYCDFWTFFFGFSFFFSFSFHAVGLVRPPLCRRTLSSFPFLSPLYLGQAAFPLSDMSILPARATACVLYRHRA